VPVLLAAALRLEMLADALPGGDVLLALPVADEQAEALGRIGAELEADESRLLHGERRHALAHRSVGFRIAGRTDAGEDGGEVGRLRRGGDGHGGPLELTRMRGCRFVAAS